MMTDTAAPRRSTREDRVPGDGISGGRAFDEGSGEAPERLSKGGSPGGEAARAQPRTLVKLVHLPPPNPKRWTVRRKAEVVAAVRSGRIGTDEACRRYRLSSEEFLSWQWLIERHGLAGLRATRIQEFRESAGRPFDQRSGEGFASAAGQPRPPRNGGSASMGSRK